jgi:hypothetical protein
MRRICEGRYGGGSAAALFSTSFVRPREHQSQEMVNHLTHEAAIPNPALQSMAILVGDWSTVGSHPLLPNTPLHGRSSFEWLQGGAFLITHSEIDEPGVPSGIAIFGSDDTTGEISMLYFDERGVSRRYQVSMDGNVWRCWRDSPGFSQRFTGTLSDDGRTIIGKWELSKDGVSWEADLELTYTRME